VTLVRLVQKANAPPDIGNAVADDEVGQAAVGSERLAANAGDTVGIVTLARGQP